MRTCSFRNSKTATTTRAPNAHRRTHTHTHAHAHAHALSHGGSPQVASHATTKEESPTIVERFRNNVFAYVTGTQVSNNLDVPRPGLCGPRPGLHEAVCRIICSRRHGTSRKRRSGSECASAPRKRDASRMFLFRLAQDGERRQLNTRGQGAVSRSRQPQPDRAAARRHRRLAGKADALQAHAC
jgi:hypothetical protein